MVALKEKNKQHYVWQKNSTTYQHVNIIPSVKYGARNILSWGCFADSGPGQPATIKGNNHFQVYHDIVMINMKDETCVCIIGLRSLCASMLVTCMRIGSHLVTSSCMRPGRSKGLTYFLLQLYIILMNRLHWDSSH